MRKTPEQSSWLKQSDILRVSWKKNEINLAGLSDRKDPDVWNKSVIFPSPSRARLPRSSITYAQSPWAINCQILLYLLHQCQLLRLPDELTWVEGNPGVFDLFQQCGVSAFSLTLRWAESHLCFMSSVVKDRDPNWPGNLSERTNIKSPLYQTTSCTAGRNISADRGFCTVCQASSGCFCFVCVTFGFICRGSRDCFC